MGFQLSIKQNVSTAVTLNLSTWVEWFEWNTAATHSNFIQIQSITWKSWVKPSFWSNFIGPLPNGGWGEGRGVLQTKLYTHVPQFCTGSNKDSKWTYYGRYRLAPYLFAIINNHKVYNRVAKKRNKSETRCMKPFNKLFGNTPRQVTPYEKYLLDFSIPRPKVLGKGSVNKHLQVLIWFSCDCHFFLRDLNYYKLRACRFCHRITM